MTTAWWPAAQKSEPCQDAATTVKLVQLARLVTQHLALVPGTCQVLPGTCQVPPGTYQAPTRYKHLVNEYLTAPTRLPHNSCRLSISVYMPPKKGSTDQGGDEESCPGEKPGRDPEFKNL